MTHRLPAIDFVRGLAMIIMALDHVRDFMHESSLSVNPTDLTNTTPALFFTRFITHLCAPIFVFLAGTSVFLNLQKTGKVTETRKLLFKRGMWLLVLEFTLVNFAIFFDIGFHTYLFEVIAAIGFGFIVLALLLKTPSALIGLIGILIIFGHGLFNAIPFGENSLLQIVLNPFFNPTALSLFSGKILVIGYPPIPWLGIMLAGFSVGRYFNLEASRREKLFVTIGLSFILLFVIIRVINAYGDPAAWSTQKNFLYTVLSFMNITKYSPSLIFSLFTLGVMFFLLALADRFPSSIKRVVITYGKVPLFYFVLHFYLAHGLTLLMLFVQGFTWTELEFANNRFGRPSGVDSGLPLWAIYIVWIFVVAVLYKPCLWFSRYKASHTHWWLKYV